MKTHQINGKILIVDGNANSAALLEDFFQQWFPHVKICTKPTALEAICNVCKNEYDLIITDFILPDLTAMEMASAIKTKGIDIPVIFISSLEKDVLTRDMTGFCPDVILKTKTGYLNNVESEAITYIKAVHMRNTAKSIKIKLEASLNHV